MSTTTTIEAIDAALMSRPVAPVVVFDQANADCITAIDGAISALIDLRMTLDPTPDDRPSVNELARVAYTAVAEAFLARGRYIAAADAMAACPTVGAN